MMLIQDSKVREDRMLKIIRKLWKDENFIYREDDVAFGGLMTLWNLEIICISKYRALVAPQRYIHTLATNFEYNIDFIIKNLYASNDSIERNVFG